MTKHTQEHDVAYVYGPNEISSANPVADARRIVACVNACAGIPTELLEQWQIIDLLGDIQLDEIDAAQLRGEG